MSRTRACNRRIPGFGRRSRCAFSRFPSRSLSGRPGPLREAGETRMCRSRARPQAKVQESAGKRVGVAEEPSATPLAITRDGRLQAGRNAEPKPLPATRPEEENARVLRSGLAEPDRDRMNKERPPVSPAEPARAGAASDRAVSVYSSAGAECYKKKSGNLLIKAFDSPSPAYVQSPEMNCQEMPFPRRRAGRGAMAAGNIGEGWRSGLLLSGILSVAGGCGGLAWPGQSARCASARGVRGP